MARVRIFEDRCKGCRLCTTVCPKNVLEIRRDRINIKGFYSAGVVNEDKCVGCASCAMVCPDMVIEIER